MKPQNAYEALMEDVYVGLGYCGCIKRDRPMHDDFLIPPYGPVTADQFAEWVILADNMNPNTDGHKTEIRQAFVKHMGGEVVDAALLRWEISPSTQAGPDAKLRGSLPDLD